jgi:CRISPR-associated protein Cas2
MVVVILESVPKTVRGELTRWLLELRAGVFAGNISAIVRDKLWETLFCYIVPPTNRAF